MRKIYFVMIFAILFFAIFAVSCDFDIFAPLEEIEVPSAPIPQRATNSAGIDVVEDAELLNIIERLEYKDGTLEKVTHTFEIDGKPYLIMRRKECFKSASVWVNCRRAISRSLTENCLTTGSFPKAI